MKDHFKQYLFIFKKKRNNTITIHFFIALKQKVQIGQRDN